MGRVIRHKYDYGAILLADERFGSAGNQRQLSKWLRTQLMQYQNFGQAIGELLCVAWQSYFAAVGAELCTRR
jgi:Rad3-related DNA helicase